MIPDLPVTPTPGPDHAFFGGSRTGGNREHDIEGLAPQNKAQKGTGFMRA